MSNGGHSTHRPWGSRLPAEHHCRSGGKVGGFQTNSMNFNGRFMLSFNWSFHRFLFLAVIGRRGGRILRMSMNGYNRRTLVATNRGEPHSLTYNAELKHIFW